MLRRIFGPKKDKVAGEWRKLHTEDLNDLYCSPSFVRVVKLKRMRRACRVACMGESRGICRLWWGNLRERDHLEDPGFRWEDNIKMHLQEVGA